MRLIPYFVVGALAMGTLGQVTSPVPASEDKTLNLILRSRIASAQTNGPVEVVETRADWRPAESAIIVCDVWDHHWCKGAEQRLAPLLPRMNALLKEARRRGVLIIHAPSDTMKFYDQTPQRALAKNAPPVKPPQNLKRPDPALPIDDSDGGCDCAVPCRNGKPYPWTREHPAIEIGPADPITDKGPEVYNLLRQHGIRHVMILGVHANMCILNRSFAIKQLVRWGFDTALVRDLTDTMYNSRKAPFVPHEKGTDLVIEHIEKYWCPSISSDQILGDSKKN
jgi:nicotinamidase-related amidase